MTEWFTDLDHTLHDLVAQKGPWAYWIVGLLVAAQTFVILGWAIPGNALIFSAGLVAAAGGMRAVPLFSICVALTLACAMLNYFVGRWLGPRLFARDAGPLSRSKLAKTEAFFARHGWRTMLLAPYVPFARSLAPLVAGMGRVGVWPFALASGVGFGVWIALLMAAGAWLGGVPWIRENLAAFLITFASLVFANACWAAWRSARRNPATSQVL